MQTLKLSEPLQLLVLSILERGPLSGMEIIAQVQQRTGGFFDLCTGHLYPLLHLMEQEQHICGEFRPTSRSGTLVRYYALTPQGRSGLHAHQHEVEHITRTLPFLLR